MNAEMSSGSRVRSWCWVLLLAVIVSATTYPAQAGAPQQHKSGLAPFQCWLGVVGNQGSASFAHDAVLLCKDFADPGTLQVPNSCVQAAIQPVKAQVKSARLMPERIKMLGQAGCLMLPGWRLRLTTLSLLAR